MVWAKDYEIPRWTVDGGGDMWGYGDDYELSGTIGQPDAGAMTGGDFELTGGFWFVAGGPTILRGDLNCDGSVDFGDINPFVLILTNFQAWQQTYQGCPWQNGDIDGNGSVDFGDINPFVALLTRHELPIPWVTRRASAAPGHAGAGRKVSPRRTDSVFRYLPLSGTMIAHARGHRRKSHRKQRDDCDGPALQSVSVGPEPVASRGRHAGPGPGLCPPHPKCRRGTCPPRWPLHRNRSSPTFGPGRAPSIATGRWRCCS